MDLSHAALYMFFAACISLTTIIAFSGTLFSLGQSLVRTRVKIQEAAADIQIKKMRLEANRKANRHGKVYQHVKTLGLYELLHTDARMENDPSLAVVVYAELRGSRVWVRPRSEFFDGRFVPHEK